MLLKLMLDGAFLVRSGERVQNSFAITFMADKKVKHCLIKKEGRLFLIGTAQFESLVDLVAHYEKNPLYKKVKLKTPVTEELLARRGNMSPGGPGEPGYSGEGGEGYMDPALFTSKTCARALYEYKVGIKIFSQTVILSKIFSPGQTGGRTHLPRWGPHLQCKWKTFLPLLLKDQHIEIDKLRPALL